jgi:hypothetical protein
VPSPQVKVWPREVVTLNVPRRINRLSKNRSNRSIGRPHHSNPLAAINICPKKG